MRVLWRVIVTSCTAESGLACAKRVSVSWITTYIWLSWSWERFVLIDRVTRWRLLLMLHAAAASTGQDDNIDDDDDDNDDVNAVGVK